MTGCIGSWLSNCRLGNDGFIQDRTDIRTGKYEYINQLIPSNEFLHLVTRRNAKPSHHHKAKPISHPPLTSSSVQIAGEATP